MHKGGEHKDCTLKASGHGADACAKALSMCSLSDVETYPKKVTAIFWPQPCGIGADGQGRKKWFISKTILADFCSYFKPYCIKFSFQNPVRISEIQIWFKKIRNTWFSDGHV